VGRLSPEKGIGDLLEAWGVVGPRLPLKIVGDGPLRAEVVAAAESNASIEWLGPRSREDVLRLMGRARVVVVPSRCYETFGLVVIEAFAKGTPVIVSAGGALAELVEHGRTGRHFLGGDGSALVEQAGWFASHPDDAARMGREARREFEE